MELKNTYTGDYITLYGADESTVKNLGTQYEKIKDAYRLFVPNTKAATELIVKRKNGRCFPCGYR